MASSREYLAFILGQLSELDEITYRAMMGAKEMLLVEEVDNREFLTGLFNAVYEELTTPKPKK